MSSTLQRTISTPTKNATATVQESPGNWRHPRLAEITRRQNATTFGEKNVRRIAWNIALFVGIIAATTVLQRYLPFTQSCCTSSPLRWAYKLILGVPVVNIAVACLPLVRPKDDLADIPLTPGQRKLLGLGPSSAPPTPGSVYSTPPRYSRTPSMSGSTGSRRSFSNLDSPSAYRSPGDGANLNLGASASQFSPAGSPLIQKAFNGARRSSISSIGSPSPFGKSFGMSTSASIFGGAPDSPSPSPANGKRSTVGLNNKWLYEKGRRSSGNAWA
ncbi:hypothetical protein JX266_001765 [Neoarthrinium moseri]|uniref:uncharacterized protein n=1 Tax=Neoarthrinium moseri TaxID=1658444 RepID=UPI001FDD3D01|nr:uncharacterized protein JN550_009449 [Neoarthrinium moseri]KAI1853781.1 hypothetical protein JX266_001765 [Neoarthrinium moseri]KAI1863749.1 hypothetical protein JN550_009449 [Neoarthrinium moseri]